ncbi:MAG: hypothetical protein JJ900_09830 [Rhodospirillales bacterium]|nr:hypothetical protein [Rhodospirillales bacterium]MBO6787138.1 hypothetical protein [Rhodospirillales bacterium]
MKPIVGELSYKELSPEDIARFTREAEIMRAQEIHSMFRAIGRGVAHLAGHAAHGFRNLVANPGIHPASKAH